MMHLLQVTAIVLSMVVTDCLSHSDVCSEWPESETGYFDGKCYRYFSEKKTFEDAQRECVSQGGTLAEIMTQSIFQEFHKIKLTSSAWLGGVYDQPRNYYVWQSDRTVLNCDTHWWKDSGSTGDCIAINKNNYLEIADCDDKYAFFCQKRLKSTPHFSGLLALIAAILG